MEITFARHYRGPLTSANGGYACGRLASLVRSDEVEVTLRLPPPLERALTVRREDDHVLLHDGAAVVAEARPAAIELEPPAPVSLAAAVEARSRHVGDFGPEFSECFVCGRRDDGLRVWAGAVDGRAPLHASPVVLPESSPELVWAAIDCPGAYAVGDEGRGTIVLGRMTARVQRVPAAGEQYVAVSWPLGGDGRKLYAGTALFDEAGDVLALAKQVWIAPRA